MNELDFLEEKGYVFDSFFDAEEGEEYWSITDPDGVLLYDYPCQEGYTDMLKSIYEDLTGGIE